MGNLIGVRVGKKLKEGVKYKKKKKKEK